MRIISATTSPTQEPPTLRAEEWRDSLTSAVVPTPGADALTRRLQEPGALVVTTGQQPGLFTGPAYTIHKAIAAASLARSLTTKWERPVVPLFWLAGDDHDFAEASVATWPDLDGRPFRWALPPRDARAVQLPMTEERLPSGIADGVARLIASLPHGAARDQTAEWLQRHYRAGQTFHGAFRDALAAILAPLGILCIDPTVPAFKRAQAPLLREALHRATELDQLLASLPESATGIASGEGATLVFLRSSAGRDRLLVEGSGFKTRRSGEVFSREALFALLEAAPERFSANVLLRPVVESALLPTVSYVAGPGEYRYLTTQAAALYPALGVPRQTPVRRWGGTLVEAWADRVAERLGVSVEAVMLDTGALAATILKRDVPTDVVQALAALRSALATAGETLETASTAIDPGLHRSVVGRRERISTLVTDLERRFDGHLRRKSDTAYSQYRRLHDALVPLDQPQERVYTGAAFLGRHGDEWLTKASAAAEPWGEGLVDPQLSHE